MTDRNDGSWDAPTAHDDRRDSADRADSADMTGDDPPTMRASEALRSRARGAAIANQLVNAHAPTVTPPLASDAPSASIDAVVAPESRLAPSTLPPAPPTPAPSALPPPPPRPPPPSTLPPPPARPLPPSTLPPPPPQRAPASAVVATEPARSARSSPIVAPPSPTPTPAPLPPPPGAQHTTASPAATTSFDDNSVVLLDRVSGNAPHGAAPRRSESAAGGIVVVATGSDAERVRKLCHRHGLLVPVMTSIAVVHDAMSIVVIGEPAPPAADRVVHVVRPSLPDDQLLALLRTLAGGRVLVDPPAAPPATDPKIAEAARKLASLTDRGAIEATAVLAITALTGSDRAHCLFHDPATGALWSEARKRDRGDDRHSMGGLVGWSAQTGQPIHASPAGDDPRWLLELDDPDEGKPQSRLLVQPIIGADRRVHAVLVAVRRWRHNDFSDREVKALAMFAALAGPAIDLAVAASPAEPRKDRSTLPRTAASALGAGARTASDSRPPIVTARKSPSQPPALGADAPSSATAATTSRAPAPHATHDSASPSAAAHAMPGSASASASAAAASRTPAAGSGSGSAATASRTPAPHDFASAPATASRTPEPSAALTSSTTASHTPAAGSAPASTAATSSTLSSGSASTSAAATSSTLSSGSASTSAAAASRTPAPHATPGSASPSAAASRSPAPGSPRAGSGTSPVPLATKRPAADIVALVESARGDYPLDDATRVDDAPGVADAAPAEGAEHSTRRHRDEPTMRDERPRAERANAAAPPHRNEPPPRLGEPPPREERTRVDPPPGDAEPSTIEGRTRRVDGGARSPRVEPSMGDERSGPMESDQPDERYSSESILSLPSPPSVVGTTEPATATLPKGRIATPVALPAARGGHAAIADHQPGPARSAPAAIADRRPKPSRPRTATDSVRQPRASSEPADLAIVAHDDDAKRVQRIAKKARLELSTFAKLSDAPDFYQVVTIGETWSPSTDARIVYAARSSITDEQLGDLLVGLTTRRAVAPAPALVRAQTAAEARRSQLAFAGARKLAAATDLAAAEDIATETLRELLDIDRAYCVFVDPDTGALWSETRRRAGGDDRRAIAGIAGWTARTGRAVSVARASADPRWLGPIDDPDGDPNSQLLLQPMIRADGRVHGILVAVRRPRRPGFTDTDTILLARFAALAAPLFEQVAVHVETQALIGDDAALRSAFPAAPEPTWLTIVSGQHPLSRWVFLALGAVLGLLLGLLV